MEIIKTILRIISKSIIIALTLLLAICFENIKVRMGIAFFIYSFILFIILKNRRD